MGCFVDEEIVCTNVCSDRTISDDKTVVDDDIIIEEATPGELDAYDDIYDCSGYLRANK